MTLRLIAAFLCLGAGLAAATQNENAPLPSARDILRAQLAEAAKNPTGKPVAGTPAAAPPITETARALEKANSDSNPLLAHPAAETDSSKAADVRKEPAMVLPKVEVSKPRITELDHKLAEEDVLIAREKKNTKPTEVDKALNDVKIAHPLAIFGGESAQYRSQVASQRVSLMEDEKDIIEAIAHEKTKAEKAELQKQLDALRTERRELEQAMR